MANFSCKYGPALAVLLGIILLPVQVLAAEMPLEAELQEEMLALINAEREREGFSPLIIKDELTAVALAHAQDMIARDYFSHLSPENVSPADRLHRAGISFAVMGENLAGSTSVSRAHDLLMRSPCHRANILDARFQEAGIAVVKGGRYGLMMVMLFKD
ncbi:MAG: CAP domain-containing protein [bacterium]